MIRALLADLQIRVMDVREQDALVQPLPKGLGTQIMERFDIPAGPKVGQLRNMLIHAIEIGNLEPNQDSEVYLSYLADLLVDSNQDD
jgi:poly(A) polymerase